MALTPGTRLGPYEITGLLGEGGMGQVYRATDTKLKREVAIKVLPEGVSGDPERLARFQREAEVLASLNHPNIAHIYGLEGQAGQAGQVGRSSDAPCLIMELVEGPTLGDRIARGPIPVNEALPIAKQIAEALEAAHERGIIHRDLKPANVKVRPDGTVKVLDFGLAKAMEPGGPEGPHYAGSASMSPTITTPAMTAAGMILGTAAYMSPEQARGKPVDRRADIWAFGCVFYEMLTGKRAFPGTDVTDILAAIVRDDPDWDALPEANPRVQELIERCLAKDPRQRWHDIADVRVDVERLQADPRGSSPAATGPKGGSRRVVAAGLVGLAVGLAATLAVWSRAPGSVEPNRTVRFAFNVPSGPNEGPWSGVTGRVAISPDGSHIAYLGTRAAASGDASGEPVRQIFVRALPDSTGTPIPGTEGATDLFFSPDGDWIGFAAGGWMRKVPIGGGAPLDITPWAGSFQGGADWGADDTIIFGGGISAGLQKVAAAGGTPEPLTAPDPNKGEISHGYPDVLPDGRTVLFAVGSQDGSRIARLSLDTDTWEDIGLSGSRPRYLPSGYLAFSQNGNLRLVGFDLDTMQPRGSVRPVLDGIEAVSQAGLEIASFDLSRTGDLVFVPGGLNFRTQPAWVDRSGRETIIEAAPGRYLGPAVSPDGSRFAAMRADAQGIGKMWVTSRDGSQGFPVGGGGAEYNPAWAPDGATLTFTSNGNLFEKNVDEDAPATELLHRDGYQMPRSWSSDGKRLAFREVSATGSRLWVVSRGGEPEPLTGASANASTPRFAPQGGWIAYASDETGRNEIYVRRYPGSQRAELVSRGGGREPAWSRDGRELFYRSGDRMMAVKISTEPELKVGNPVELWTHPYFSQEGAFPNYDVAPDGRFLMLAIPGVEDMDTITVNVVLGWISEAEDQMRNGDLD